MSRDITRAYFEKEVKYNDHLSLVHFRKDWSGACHIISPIYEELSRSYEGIADFFCIDVEKEAGVEKEFGLKEFPTILFFKDGELIDHAIGLTPKTTLISKIEQALIQNNLKNSLYGRQ